MNNERIFVEERSRDIGQFLVGRLLPMRKKRQVGPFTFIDHMGPAVLSENNYMDVDQHPHIGLSTLTYLLEGSIEHRDSTGSVQVIEPGDVGFMTAGKGVTHTERTPANLRTGASINMHGYQIWVAMPKPLEETDPTFQYIKADELPIEEDEKRLIKTIAGEGFGLTSPLKVHSPLFMVEFKAKQDQYIEIKGELQGEIAIVVVTGEAHIDDQVISQGQMLISKTENECAMQVTVGTHLLLFGGEPLPEERHLMWNFVSSSKERLKKAKADWDERMFPKVPGDETYVPFP